MFVPVRLGANYVLSDRSSIVVSSQKKKERRTKEDVKSSLTRLRLRNKPSATNLPSPACLKTTKSGNSEQNSDWHFQIFIDWLSHFVYQ